jgi:hypothetical protein
MHMRAQRDVCSSIGVLSNQLAVARVGLLDGRGHAVPAQQRADHRLEQLRRLLNALERALAPEPSRARDDDDGDGLGTTHGGERRGTAAGAARARPRLFWLSVTTVADERLPAWKRPRMSASLARRYNELALPELRRHGVQYIDTHTRGAAHPELSLDGVHFGGAMSRWHAELFWPRFWRALCERDGAPQSGR